MKIENTNWFMERYNQDVKNYISTMNTFKVIIAGGRDFKDYSLLEEKCNLYLRDKQNIEIISGCARGTDKLGEVYAAYHRYKIKRFPADWERFGKAGGYIRNKQMAKYASPNGGLICFWDGRSKGSKHMIDLAEKYKLLIRIVRY